MTSPLADYLKMCFKLMASWTLYQSKIIFKKRLVRSLCINNDPVSIQSLNNGINVYIVWDMGRMS